FNRTSPNILIKGENMGTTKLLILVIVISLNTAFAQESIEGPSSSPHLEGPYLGQKPPGLIPKAFAPGIVTTEHYEFSGVFTPDMKEFYLIRDGGKYEKPSFVVFQNKNNRWHESVMSPR